MIVSQRDMVIAGNCLLVGVPSEAFVLEPEMIHAVLAAHDKTQTPPPPPVIVPPTKQQQRSNVEDATVFFPLIGGFALLLLAASNS